MAISGSILLLSACTTYWAMPGATQSDLTRDSYECERDARQSGYFNNGFELIAFAQRCMMARGWMKVSAPTAEKHADGPSQEELDAKKRNFVIEGR